MQLDGKSSQVPRVIAAYAGYIRWLLRHGHGMSENDQCDKTGLSCKP
jgi:hypothetical protein